VKEPKKPEEPEDKQDRKSIISGNDAKYLSSLGIDSSILDTQSTEFAKWLDYFGWVPGEQMRARTFDEMKQDVDREMSKAAADGWLARFQDEDERVNAIKKGIDVAINECDELDNLLTLYSVELSVSLTVRWLTYLANTFGRLSTTISPTSKRRARVSRCKQRIRSSSRRSLSLYSRLAPSALRISKH
jgi:exocyst complex component Sec3